MISASSQSARRILVASLGSFVLDASFARFFAALFASYGSRRRMKLVLIRARYPRWASG